MSYAASTTSTAHLHGQKHNVRADSSYTRKGVSHLGKPTLNLFLTFPPPSSFNYIKGFCRSVFLSLQLPGYSISIISYGTYSTCEVIDYTTLWTQVLRYLAQTLANSEVLAFSISFLKDQGSPIPVPHR